MVNKMFSYCVSTHLLKPVGRQPYSTMGHFVFKSYWWPSLLTGLQLRQLGHLTCVGMPDLPGRLSRQYRIRKARSKKFFCVIIKENVAERPVGLVV